MAAGNKLHEPPQSGVGQPYDSGHTMQRESTTRTGGNGGSAEGAEQSQASEDPKDEDFDSEDSRREDKKPRRESKSTANIRQRRRKSDRKTSGRVVPKTKKSYADQRTSSQPDDGSLHTDLAKDAWRFFKVSSRLPRLLYPIWKWMLLLYLVWMVLSYLLAFLYQSVTTALSPMCSVPILGSKLMFCNWSTEGGDRPIDVSKVATSQEVLTIVMDRVGQNFDLARDMTGHEFAIRDLRIRVAASNLSRRQELARELDSLSRYTKQTAKSLSRFTAKVSKSIDTVHTFDDYAIKALESIAERERNPSTLPSRVMSAMSPFAAFGPPDAAHSEEQVKHVFISTADRISNKVKLLIDDSFDLGHSLDAIQETLDRIKELALDEIGDLPRLDVLGALWTRLAHADDYNQHQSHSSLLTDMTDFYESSSYIMEETVAALNRVEAELSEFRDDFATPGLILKDYPVEVTIALLRKSGQRLEAGKKNLESIEEGAARPQKYDKGKTSTRVVSIN